MKSHSPLLLLAGLSVLSLASCTTSAPPSTLTPESFLSLKSQPALRHQSYRVTCELISYDGERTRPSSVVVRLGEEALIGNTVDWVVPTRYSLADLSATDSGSYALHRPTKPSAFEKVQVGRVLRLKLQAHGPFVEGHGVLLSRRGTNDGKSYGDATLPIHQKNGQLLTENALTLPEFRTAESYVHFIGTPGKAHRMELPEQRMQVLVTVEPVH